MEEWKKFLLTIVPITDEMHVEFRMYNPGVKPLTVDTKAFNPESFEMCKIDMNGFI